MAIVVLDCKKCEHQWARRTGLPAAALKSLGLEMPAAIPAPLRCPKCGRRDWNGPVDSKERPAGPARKCLRCEFEWHSRTEAAPRLCPRCKSYQWANPRQGDVYPFNNMEVGQAVLVPWRQFQNGDPDVKSNAKITAAARMVERRRKFKFRLEPRGRGLFVTRLS